jgi:hypothetical protein
MTLLASTTSAVAASPRAVPSIGTQLAELKGSDTVHGDYFGYSVAISGTTAVVGAPGHASAGRAYVFTKTASGWQQTVELKGSSNSKKDQFGSAVAISGTTAIVGADSHAHGAGAAYVFAKTASSWKQVAELKGSDAVAHDSFGYSVAISGTTAVVGAWGHANGAGRVYVFMKTRSGWKQAAELKGSDTVAGDSFGISVAILGTIVVVGAFDHANYVGCAYVFAKTAGLWKQTAELKGANSVALDQFGSAVAISGTTVVVGAFDHANSSGRVYVFMKTRSGWKQAVELKGSNTVGVNYFGESVGVSGSTAVVGAWGHTKDAGRAYVFTKMGGVWKQTAQLKGSDTVTWDAFGESVAISGTTAVVGAFGHANNAGSVYVFEG